MFSNACRLVALPVACAVVISAAPKECGGCLTARYWSIPQSPPDSESLNCPTLFPECEYVKGKPSLGLAFSGGGTRSAAATLGQLRGLRANGWLDHVRYISAISGGGWASVPFTFTKRPLDEFLGRYEAPGALLKDAVEHEDNGRLSKAIANSGLLAAGLPEGAAAAAQIYATSHSSQLLTEILGLTNRLRREPDRLDKTYARLLAPIFVDGDKNDELIEPGTTNATRLFSWNTATANEMSRIGHVSDFVVSGPDRPFLIATGTIVSARTDYDYPLLMPVEYTPLYVGVRHQFGGRFGGSYIWPWAYDPVGAEKPPTQTDGVDTVDVHYDDAHKFTLADVVASTGAAPELAVVLGASLPEKYQSKVQLGAQVFPAFRHVSVQQDGASVTDALPHADGGAEDNLGIMPLLARHVGNIIVFINTETRYVENNDDLQSLFVPVYPPGLSGDKRHNVVFDQGLHQRVVGALREARERGDAQVYCDGGWNVLANARFGIGPYSGLNICFVYNAAVPRWEAEFKTNGDVLQLAKEMKNFPWFSTFEQNKPNVIKLTTAEVNLLSNLTAWTIANPQTTALILKTITVLPMSSEPDVQLAGTSIGFSEDTTPAGLQRRR
jgi:hypothetical protein